MPHKLYSLFLFLLLAQLVQGQNLVPNPSFEDTVYCPHQANQIDYAAHWHASSGSPDYFNQCDMISGNGNLAVPHNVRGYQYAHTGNAYAGFIAFGRTGSNVREDFTCQLVSNLTVGSKYNVSMYLNSAGSLGLSIACNKIGMLFSTFNYNFPIDTAPVGNYSQFYTDSIVTDTTNWVLISGSFIADSAYSYLSIGNFFVDSLTDTIYPGQTSYAFYFIDDISVVEDTENEVEDFLLNLKAPVYPNPARDYITVKVKLSSDSKVEIINSSGIAHENLHMEVNSEELKIPVSNLLPGMYLIKISDEKNIAYYKFIKL